MAKGRKIPALVGATLVWFAMIWKSVEAECQSAYDDDWNGHDLGGHTIPAGDWN